MRFYLTILATLLLYATAPAQNKTLKAIVPDHVRLQYAGNIGLVSAGLGYNFINDRLQLTIMDGFVPASIAGNNINTIALKGSYDILQLHVARKTLAPYAGLATMFETSGNGVYKTLPARYIDRKYYQMSAFHLAVFAGGKLALPVGTRQGQKLELYAETGTLDSYIYYYCKNEILNFTDMFSMAIGVSYHFGNK